MLAMLKIRWKSWARVAIIMVVLAGMAFASSLLTISRGPSAAANLQPLSLSGYHRMLVLAPHCDDETLGSAGLILAAERAGVQVRVVIATNGDGFLFATIQDFRKLYPHPQDFIRFGEVRQQESLAALKILGVQADQVSFLGYPDRGTPSEWNDHWLALNPYRSPYSQDSKSPYPLTYDPQADYSGQDFLGDLTSILNSYRPDLIVYPNPDDVHPDHWGLNAFTRLAIAEMAHSDPSFRPTEFTYLIHRPDFPTVKGLKPEESLVPPPALQVLYPDWFRLDLTPADVQRKGNAVQAYRTQLPLLHGLMDSFIRSNELFEPVDRSILPSVAKGNPLSPSSWVDASGKSIQPIERDPVGDFITRQAVPGADLIASYAAKSDTGQLWLCSQVRDEVTAGITYRLRVKALDANGIRTFQARTGPAQAGWEKAEHSDVYTCAQVSLSTLGNPWAVFIGTDVEAVGRLVDQTGWQLVNVP